MTDAKMRDWDELRPNAVRTAVVLWWLTAGLTVLMSFVAFMMVADRVRFESTPRVLGGLAIGIVLAVLAITRFGRGGPVARVALTGMTVYYVWTLVVGVTVLVDGESQAPVAMAVIEVVRTLCAVVATFLSYTGSARQYFRAHNADATRARGAIIAGAAWLVGILAMAVIITATFVDNLPSHGRSWIEWAEGSNALGTALVMSLVLCLFPAYAAVVREFEYGRQWTRVTLTVLGAGFVVLALFQALDVFDDSNPSALETVGAVLCLGYIVSVLAAVALSYLPAINAHVREARGGDMREWPRPA